MSGLTRRPGAGLDCRGAREAGLELAGAPLSSQAEERSRRDDLTLGLIVGAIVAAFLCGWLEHLERELEHPCHDYRCEERQP